MKPLTIPIEQLAPVFEELHQRIASSYATDQDTGEHKDATPLDYLKWAIEELTENYGQ